MIELQRASDKRIRMARASSQISAIVTGAQGLLD
jgi:hypothetical protein